jgi:pyridoxal phosphate enzyme (YggS family)
VLGQGPDDTAVAERLARVRARVRAAALRAGRHEDAVSLLAVSKKQDAGKIRAAYRAGQGAFGENYLQEALEKMEALGDLDLEWHFIGRIQSNKTRQIAEHFAWVHSLCDLHHARRLSEQRPAGLPPLKACVQINLEGEATKGGLAPDALGSFLTACAGLEKLDIVGLMTLPAPAKDEAAQRLPFRALRELRDRLATPDCPLETLSMGMSDDLEAAIAEGATLVRIGTAVFGPRA